MTPPLHSWRLTPAEAVAVQKNLADRIRLVPPAAPLTTVAGCDISYNKYSPDLYAAVVVLSLPDLTVLETVTVKMTVKFPYVPGLLSFREAPPLLEAFTRLNLRPSAVMLDGQGTAHPRRFGVACHLGLWLDVPTLGCAKSRFVGTYEPPGENSGDSSPLLDERGESIGMVLRTKRRTNPVFVSPGHRMDTGSAVKLVMATVNGYRIPAPTRFAHIAANEARSTGKATFSLPNE